jgi:membrane-associated HD superfamily phosphohydrolase
MPLASAELIHRHVQDGIDLAREAHLPGTIIDFIPQHHGTRVVGYFFHKAKELAARSGEPPPQEQEFRYAGPKPQTREAALLMIGEAVVASSRQVADGPVEEQAQKLRLLVERAVDLVWSDGQLDECDLTSRDLARVKQAFVATMLQVKGAQASTAPPPRPPALRVVAPEEGPEEGPEAGPPQSAGA